jgi:pimeloyl-ACP methyl ester carboxylesterase
MIPRCAARLYVSKKEEGGHDELRDVSGRDEDRVRPHRGRPAGHSGERHVLRSADDARAGRAARAAIHRYDRRGRGESGDTAPYAVDRELEDLAALIDQVGGAGFVYGHSSGAGLAINAAARGLPITRLVLHEAPYGGDDEESKQAARELAANVGNAIAEDRRADAIKLFMAASGMPPEMVEAMSTDPKMQAVAPTMPYDFAIMGDSDGGTIPEDLVRAIGIPTLVIAGGASPQFFRDAAIRIAELPATGRAQASP